MSHPATRNLHLRASNLRYQAEAVLAEVRKAGLASNMTERTAEHWGKRSAKLLAEGGHPTIAHRIHSMLNSFGYDEHGHDAEFGKGGFIRAASHAVRRKLITGARTGKRGGRYTMDKAGKKSYIGKKASNRRYVEQMAAKNRKG